MLSDLDICKRIAEIEGLEVVYSKTFDIQRIAVKKGYYNRKEYESGARNIAIEVEYFKHNTFNPLTDDALCFQLMVKHQIKLEPCVTKGWIAWYEYFDCGMWDCPNESPNRAICLAIIEANS